MKYIISTLLLILLFSCYNSEEVIETQKNIFQTKGFDNGAPIDPLIIERMNLQTSLELASYIFGRTILNHGDATNFIINISTQNNGIVVVNNLIGLDENNPFKTNFFIEFNRLWGKPGNEDYGVEPIGYRGSLENILDIENEFKIDHYQEYLLFLKELNCLELFFPIPLNFNENNMRITVTIPRLFSNENSNIGGELYQIERGGSMVNAGHHLLVDTDYLFGLVHSDNNLLILRPVRNGQENCEYPTDIYLNDDFNAFLNF